MDKKRNKQNRKKEEQRAITHLNHGFDFEGDSKGVSILASSGITDMNPEPTKGVEIHESRNG